MLMVNGARVEWAGYEYGVKLADGHVWECIDFDAAADLADMNYGSKIVMRALYQSDWFATVEVNDGDN